MARRVVRWVAQWAARPEVQRDPTLAGWPVAQTEEGWEAAMGGALAARTGAAPEELMVAAMGERTVAPTAVAREAMMAELMAAQKVVAARAEATAGPSAVARGSWPATRSATPCDPAAARTPEGGGRCRRRAVAGQRKRRATQ